VSVTGATPVFVTSNQSPPTGLLPLDHAATSETIMEGTGFPLIPSVTVNAKLTLASGVVPTAEAGPVLRRVRFLLGEVQGLGEDLRDTGRRLGHLSNRI